MCPLSRHKGLELRGTWARCRNRKPPPSREGRARRGRAPHPHLSKPSRSQALEATPSLKVRALPNELMSLIVGAT